MVTKKDVIGLNKDYKEKVDVFDYENLYVGFEFEFNLPGVGKLSRSGEDSCSEKMREICEHFGVTNGKTNGKSICKEKVNLQNGGAFEIDVHKDLYKEEKLVSQVYRDGCTDFEIVTRPVNLKRIGDVKREVFDYINEMKGDFWCNGSAGLHMTFLLDHHMERSNWSNAVIRNIMQYSRCYYKELIELCRCNVWSRKTEYRKILSGDSIASANSDHHSAISIRSKRDRKWAIEVRIPDCCDNWDKVLKMCKFWMAMIRHCANISNYGRITFDADTWEDNKSFYARYNGSNIPAKSYPRISHLARQMKDSLNFYNIDIVNGKICNKVISRKDDLIEIVWEKVLQGVKYIEIISELRKEGYSSGDILKACKEVGVK